MLIAEGLLTYLGPRGWVNRFLVDFGILDSPLRLVHNYWGVMLSLVISGFPFTFLLTLSYVTGIDPSLEQAGAMLGARSASRFREILMPLLVPGLAITFCLSFVQAFAVFPSALLLGAPAGDTRVISIAAYQAAFEDYDYSMASAIAMIMAFVQVAIDPPSEEEMPRRCLATRRAIEQTKTGATQAPANGSVNRNGARQAPRKTTGKPGSGVRSSSGSIMLTRLQESGLSKGRSAIELVKARPRLWVGIGTVVTTVAVSNLDFGRPGAANFPHDDVPLVDDVPLLDDVHIAAP